MLNIFEAITKRLTEAWKGSELSESKASFRCRCERPIYFRNSLCLGCSAPIGYEPESQQLRALVPGPQEATWQIDADTEDATVWKRCENFDSPAGCNWLVRAEEEEGLCRSCRLNQTIPNLDDPDNCEWWRKIEIAKRRLVSQLLNLGLPVTSKVSEDPEHGVMFDLLRSPKEGPG